MTNKPQNKITPYGWRQPIPTNLVEFTQGNKFAATIFMILLLRAANKDKEVMVGDNSISIKRGEAVCGVFELAEYCGLKRNEHARVKRIMDKLQNSYGLMTKRRSLNCSIVSIKNYDQWVEMTKPTAKRRLNDGRTMTTNKSVKSKENVNTVGITKLINHFNTSFGRDYKVTAGRVDKYRARRKTFTQEQLIEAVTKLAKSEFHSGGNDKGWVASPDYLLRNDEIVDSALNMKPPKKKATHKNLAELKYKQFFGGTK